MSIRTGIILPHLGPSQLNEEIIDIVNGGGDYTIFFEDVSKTYRPINVPMMNITESRYFSGRLIAFTLLSANYILNSLKHIKAEYYLYELPWLRGYNNFIENIKILRNESLGVTTRSKEYASLFNKYANREIAVKTIEEILKSD